MFDIGSRIRELRKISNMTSSELADKMSVSQSFISGLENNSKKCSMDNLFKLCEIFNIEPSDFFNEDSNAVVLTDELKSLLDSARNLSSKELEAIKQVINVFGERG